MITTLNQIRAHSPCRAGWATLLESLGKTRADDAPVSIAYILDSNGLPDALWSLRAVQGADKELREFAAWCARQVQHLNPDPRVLAAIEAAEAYSAGRISAGELTTAASAADAAYAAADAADAAYAARAAADAAYAAADAAYAAAYAAYAAADAARAARAAAYAAYAAADAARAAADADAYAADAAADAYAAQAQELRRICVKWEVDHA